MSSDRFFGFIASVLLISIASSMIQGYGKRRAQKAYGLNKTPAHSLKSFGVVSKTLFVFSFSTTVSSLWYRPDFLLIVNSNPAIQYLGLILCSVGWISLKKSFSNLGENYSPIFDAYIPKQLITSGMYSLIRHPIYLYNLFISFGLVLISGSIWVLLSALTGLFYLLYGIQNEEQYLSNRFKEYEEYKKGTWKLLPYIF